MTLNIFKKPEQPAAATTVDDVKDALRTRGIDVDAVGAELEAKRRREEAERESREADRQQRLEDKRLNHETAGEIVKNGTLLVCVNGARQVTVDVSCRCGEPLQDARDALDDFGRMWSETPDKERLIGSDSGWATLPAYNSHEKCPKCKARTHVYAQFVLEI